MCIFFSQKGLVAASGSYRCVLRSHLLLTHLLYAGLELKWRHYEKCIKKKYTENIWQKYWQTSIGYFQKSNSILYTNCWTTYSISVLAIKANTWHYSPLRVNQEMTPLYELCTQSQHFHCAIYIQTPLAANAIHASATAVCILHAKQSDCTDTVDKWSEPSCETGGLLELSSPLLTRDIYCSTLLWAWSHCPPLS